MAAVDKLVDQQHILRSCEIKCKGTQMASSSPPPEPGSAGPPPAAPLHTAAVGRIPSEGLQTELMALFIIFPPWVYRLASAGVFVGLSRCFVPSNYSRRPVNSSRVDG